jgi:hypothetical protein
MIPQLFVKGKSERVFFGPYEYPAGADIIFDFGNPDCTSAFNSSQIVYNVGNVNITGSLMGAPALVDINGGAALFDSNYMEWDWKSTVEQTNIIIFQPSGSQGLSRQTVMPQVSGSFKPNSIEFVAVYGGNTIYVDLYDSSNVPDTEFFGQPKFETGSLNGYNGWNLFATSHDSSSLHSFYVNTTTASFSSVPLARETSDIQKSRLPINGKTYIMAFLQYPKILTLKQIDQINKVFGQRYFT